MRTAKIAKHFFKKKGLNFYYIESLLCCKENALPHQFKITATTPVIIPSASNLALKKFLKALSVVSSFLAVYEYVKSRTKLLIVRYWLPLIVIKERCLDKKVIIWNTFTRIIQLRSIFCELNSWWANVRAFNQSSPLFCKLKKIYWTLKLCWIFCESLKPFPCGVSHRFYVSQHQNLSLSLQSTGLIQPQRLLKKNCNSGASLVKTVTSSIKSLYSAFVEWMATITFTKHANRSLESRIHTFFVTKNGTESFLTLCISS